MRKVQIAIQHQMNGNVQQHSKILWQKLNWLESQIHRSERMIGIERELKQQIQEARQIAKLWHRLSLIVGAALMIIFIILTLRYFNPRDISVLVIFLPLLSPLVTGLIYRQAEYYTQRAEKKWKKCSKTN